MEEINRLSSSIKTHRENEDSKNFDEIESILTKAPEILFSEEMGENFTECVKIVSFSSPKEDSPEWVHEMASYIKSIPSDLSKIPEWLQKVNDFWKNAMEKGSFPIQDLGDVNSFFSHISSFFQEPEELSSKEM